ncbi:MAG: PilN domain-containing protein [Bdellovibrionaceae bacterium]|nr:PilN domain-containing protein [Pseudobdellovibrionaceae bacterium]
MIKVNLLRDRTQENLAIPANANQLSYGEILQRNKAGGPIKLGLELPPSMKLLIIVLPLISIIAVEKYTVSRNNNAISGLLQQLSRAERQREESREAVAKIRVRESELDASRTLLNDFRQIDKDRLLPIKVLDAIQDLLPFQVWLNNVQLERTGINVEGVAVSENDLTQFQQNLEASQYFNNILIYNQQELRNEVGRYVSFRLRAGIMEGSVSGR